MSNTASSKDRGGSIFDAGRVQASATARAALALYRIAQGIEALVRKRGQSKGLSRAGVETLLFLHNAHPRSRTIGSIAQRLAVTPATATRLVDALERKGLVRRARLEKDRRTVRVELTAAGQRTLDQIVDIGEELERLVRALPTAEQECVATALTDILKAMQREGYVAASMICRQCSFFRPNAYPGTAKPHSCALTGERLSEEESYLERLGQVAGTLA